MIEIDHGSRPFSHSLREARSPFLVRIETSRRITYPRERVWPALADLGSHHRWMADASEIVFTSESRRGLGAEMEVVTVVGPFRTIDILEVTAWEEGSHIDVAHKGVITGVGRLAVRADGTASVVTWTEDLHFPWWLGGPLGALLARPLLARLWRDNLERLEGTLSDP